MSTINEYNKYVNAPVLTNNTRAYDKQAYNDKLTNFNNYVNNKNNIVHNELYKDALEYFFYDHITTYINEDFMYNMFRWINSLFINADTSDNDKYIDYHTDFIFKNLLSPKLKFLVNAMEGLSVNRYEFVYNVLYIILYGNDKLNIKYEYNVPKINGILQIIEAIKMELNPSVHFGTFINNNQIYMAVQREDGIDIVSEDNDELEHIYLYENNYIDDYDIMLDYFTTGKIFIYNNDGEEKAYDVVDYIEDKMSDNINKMINDFNDNILNILTSYLIKKYRNEHKFVELKDTEYQYPSHVFAISKEFPYIKAKYYLGDYWNTIQYKDEYDVNNIKLSKEYENMMFEAEEVNFVTNKIRYRSKLTEEEIEVDLDYYDPNIPVSDKYNYNDTFTNIINRM